MRRFDIGERSDCCQAELRPVLIREPCESEDHPGPIIGWKNSLLIFCVACEKCGCHYNAKEAFRPIGIVLEKRARAFTGPPDPPKKCPCCDVGRLKQLRYFPSEPPESKKEVPTDLIARNLPPFQTYVVCLECFRVLWVSPPQENVTQRFTLPPPGMNPRR
jgi:hypothetical protein